MPRGGKRPGAGRPKGSKNTKTREIAEKAAAEGITPLEYMLEVMRDPRLPPAQRMDAAKSAAPYIHPRLASVAVGGDPDNPIEVNHGVSEQISGHVAEALEELSRVRADSAASSSVQD